MRFFKWTSNLNSVIRRSSSRFNWKTIGSWIVLTTFSPIAAFSSEISQPIPSLSDSIVLKKVTDFYNAHLEIQSNFYQFAKEQLSPLDYGYLEKQIKKTEARRLPKITLINKTLRFEDGTIVGFSRASDGKLLVQIDNKSFKTDSEMTLFRDAVKFFQKTHKHGPVATFMNYLIPDAHAFFAILALFGLGGISYSYRHEFRNAWENLITKQEDLDKVAYIQKAREFLYSCEKEKENWEDNWYEQDWFFGGIERDNRPNLSTDTGKLKFNNSVVNTDKDLVRVTRKHLLECNNSVGSQSQNNDVLINADQEDSRAIPATNFDLLYNMGRKYKDELCKTWDEWEKCLNEVKNMKHKYALDQGVPSSEVSQTSKKETDSSESSVTNSSKPTISTQAATPGN